MIKFNNTLAKNVLPVPGGPNNNIPLGGDLNPVNRSGLCDGRTTASYKASFATSNPAIESHETFGLTYNIKYI